MTSRNTQTKKLITRQEVSLSPQEERLLRRVFDYLAGYVDRINLEKSVEEKKKLVDDLAQSLPSKLPTVSNKQENSLAFRIDLRSEQDIRIDEYYKQKEELVTLETALKSHLSSVHVIESKDIEELASRLGLSLTKKQVEQMIWEIDERLDNVICFDEFILTYCRNIADNTGSEPSSFFHLMEFLIFDETKKGYIIEDDCMEILFARYGSSKLEKELQSIFGSRLRAQGGDGTLNLSEYFKSMEIKLGRRAPVMM